MKHMKQITKKSHHTKKTHSTHKTIKTIKTNKKHNSTKNMNLQLFTNNSGVKILSIPYKNQSDTTSIYFYFKVGSKHENNEFSGISHFIEHMVYKGSKKYKKYIDISKTFDKMGISFNAYTSKELTVYYYKFISSPETLNLICKITQDMVFNPLMNETEIKNERNVIIQELKDDEDDIDEEIDDKIEELLFEGHPLGRCIIGTEKTLNNISRNDLIQYHKKYYKLDNLFIGISGNIIQKDISIINKYFNNKSNCNNNSSKNIKPMIINNLVKKDALPFLSIDSPESKYIINCIPKDLNQNYIHIMFKTLGYNDPDKSIHKIIANILGSNMSSRLFVEIREKLGLVYSIRCDYNTFEEIGYFDIVAQTEIEDTLKCISKIFEQLNKIKKYLVLDKELNDSKINIINVMKINFDDIETINEYYSKQLIMNNKIQTIESQIDKIKNIKSIEIKEVANRLFDFNKVNICIFGKSKKHDIEKIIKKYI